ncbi:PorP/SprF family type IX secretion system membrane protein [Cytophagaceae bacterium ABcell3]|nr:PorP/SprF family type IX secretion system membrane protein [Cytophagaceae bacterium ABcell3]
MKPFLTVALLAIAFSSYAQQYYSFSQYMYNPLAINPAFAGYYQVPEATFSARSQLSGIDGAGSSVALTGHGKGPGQNTGLGALASNDRIGVSNVTSFQGVYSYQLVSKNKNSYTSWGYVPEMLSFGLSAGVTRYYENLTSLNIDNDPNFAANVNRFLPTFGFGVFYSKDPFYIGASIPQLMNNFGADNINLNRHIFLNSGVHLETSAFTKLHLNTLVKYVYGAPAQADFNAVMTFHDTFKFGLGYRTVSLVNFMTGLDISKSFRMAYFYDIPLGTSRNIAFSIHEIMINYRFF